MIEQIRKAHAREAREPEELRNPIPWPVALIALGFIAWGVWYYFQSVGFPPDAGDRRSVVVVDANAEADGAAVFAGNCAACHQLTGNGLPGVFPPLAGSEWVTAVRSDVPLQILLHGINGPMQVAGISYQGVMPAFAQLKDAELAAVLTHIRTSFGNTASEVSAQEVAAARKRFADRGSPWTGGEELTQMVVNAP